MFKKILIANRGEIACRVIKTARKMGVKSVAVYSTADRRALHVRLAEESVCIGEAASSESYLRGDVIIRAALDCGAEAIHPGYGFLSENAEFERACAAAGLAFIGPSADSISAMGLKDCAKDIMNKAGVPVVPGYQGEQQDDNFLAEKAEEIGYPVLIKAVAGGGGKGMRLVEHAPDFIESLATCRRESSAAFANDHLLIEKYLIRPRHIEVQIFGDRNGNVVHLFERDCSIQRRHQKVVEEAPAPNISDRFRNEICSAAIRAAQAIDYYGAGTVEFIVQGDAFYFMEMNTRLQVEHPVTEMITGQDLVEWQLRVACGEALPLAQDDIAINGHAFESRLYAEDPSKDFMPQTGRVHHFSYPQQSQYMRVDTGIEAGDSVSVHYDPMVAKLVTWGEDRTSAALNMAELLRRTYMSGLPSNQEFVASVFDHNVFISAVIDTGFITRYEQGLIPETYAKAAETEIALATLFYLLGLGSQSLAVNPWNAHDNWRIGDSVMKRSLSLVNKGEVIDVLASCHGESLEVEGVGQVKLLSYHEDVLKALIDGVEASAVVLSYKKDITIFSNGRVVDLHLFAPELDGDTIDVNGGRLVAPMPGSIVQVMVETDSFVDKGQPLLVMDSMKVETTIAANFDGVVKGVHIAPGDQVQEGTLLIEIEQEEGENDVA
ncbi:MAG: acetyl/propionyl/methylcrotonyl-CoA carboxylase subunit alpha [Gammaproteobacteria bacterium]|nr:acetyl/propionyl/methylcrotonyl-CoA carboxylase subunit alpha [Gammaproteobacteria bacterium]